MRVMQFFLGCIGRVLISLIFILASIGHMMDWQGSLVLLTGGLQTWATYALEMPDLRPIVDQLLSHTSLLMSIAVVFMLVGGLFVFFGIKTRFGAFLLILFIVATTIVMHPFWLAHMPDRDLQLTMFMKNLAILGGLFYLLAFGNGTGKMVKKHPKSQEQDSK